MLDLIRKKQKTVIVKIVFWVIIAAFVGTIFLVWGKGSEGDGAAGTTAAATVNGDKIGFQEYQAAYRNLYELYQNVYREQFTPALEKQLQLDQQALNTLIDQTLLLQEGNRLGIEVSKTELVDSIAKISAFQENGVFNRDRYLQVLAYQRLSADDFEAMQENQLLVDKVRTQLQAGVTVSDQDVEEEFRTQNEKVNLAFVKLTPALFESQVKIEEAPLAAFFAEEREAFRIPETVALRYLQFEPDRYRDEVTYNDEEIEKFYRRHLDRFAVEEQVKASHILIKLAKDADDKTRNKKRELAEKILAEARAGKDFAELARKYSDDPGTAAKGGDLGYFPRGAMVPDFEAAAFILKPGEFSDIIETPFGLHIIRSEGYIEAGIKPLAEVIDKVKTGLAEEKIRQIALEKAMDAYNINRKNGNLEAAAKTNDLGLKETGFFSREEAIDGLGNAPEISAAAFTLKEGELARPVVLPQGVILFAVKERKESRLPELAEVRGKVEQAFRREQSKVLARQAAEEILSALGEGKKLSDLARRHNLTVEETGLFARSYGEFVPRIGNAADLAEAAFQLTKENPVAPAVYEISGSDIVATLKARQDADPADLDAARREELKKAVLTRRQEEAVKEKVNSLREVAEITIAPTLQSSFEKE
ncbi:parvulin-like peptidyl-prolyl isomerase [Desulfuromonas soudanensis]|uniref:Periplasmic chaperone PpiD n=1 Tax=Desulfuromonas soudanensis TaxID=1603606 RepID=A0A0M4D585_9BACT|nr:SurA N-terminal domain-containing protein [Desulfuromonas soudanensis]ALC15885.1 parvulin-like peptidyl-prolyl isomerase [Desulfuromonas soudanensis]